jgi:Fic family protein
MYTMIYQLPKLSVQYFEVIDRIDNLRNELKYLLQVQPRRWGGLLRRSTYARAIQGSNSIEGYNVTYEDVVAAIEGEEPLDEKAEAWQAVSGYRQAMTYILQLGSDKHYIHNEGTIRSLHFMMVQHDISKSPGRWRPGSIYVRSEPSGDIVYEGPDSDSVPGLMTELVASLNDGAKTSSILRAAMAHLNLVMIHPFSDGNGRMGRALQTFVLAREGILDPTFSSIEEYLGRNTQDYYAVLGETGKGTWSPQNDTLAWIKFCLTAHYRQAETLLRRTKIMERMWNFIEAELERRSLHPRLMYALADAASGYRVRNASYRTIAEVSEQVASRDLHSLCDEGLLIPVGERRGRHYVASKLLQAVRQRAQQTKIVTDPFTEEKIITKEPEQASLPGFGAP